MKRFTWFAVLLFTACAASRADTAPDPRAGADAFLKAWGPVLDLLAKKPEAQGIYAIDGLHMVRAPGIDESFPPNSKALYDSHMLSGSACFLIYGGWLARSGADVTTVAAYDWRVMDDKLKARIDVLTRPVPGHPDMALVLMPRTLQPGLYSIKAGSLEYGFGVQTPDVAAYWREVLVAHPDYWQAHNHLGAELYSRRDKAGAIEHWKRAVELQPNLYETHFNYALGLSMNHRALDANLPDSYNTPYDYAPGFGTNSQAQEALEEYKKAIDLGGGWTVRMNYAEALTWAGRYDQAAAQYNEVLKTEPKRAEVFYNLGTCYLRQSKWDAATDNFKNALAIRPDFPAAAKGLETAKNGPETERLRTDAIRSMTNQPGNVINQPIF